jgi:L,D-peptidoglycan transpeptidase YkuD (ErfK/YbiS/YcfS/YnhG family)
VKTLAALALLSGLLAAPAAPAAEVRAERASKPRAGTVVLDGVHVRLRPGTTQVLTVNATGGHRARVVLHVLADGRWRPVQATTDGRTGYGGLVAGPRRRQGTGTTPLGTFALLSAFGTHQRHPRWRLPYRRIRPGDFWVQDNRSPHYNRYRNVRLGGFRPHTSERLTDYGRQYEYSVVTGFNLHQVRHRGAGIFVHVNGSGATAGCVSAPRRFLRLLLARLDADRHPLVAIGR